MVGIHNRKHGIYLLIACALILRLVSFHYNEYLHGDVNSLVLVTESVGENLSFSLPYRYNQYTANPQPLDRSYRETYSQHQPLWMIIGGLIYRYIYPGGAFTALKLLSLIVGVLLLLVLVGPAMVDHRAYAGFLLSCFSIALVDYSVNGSYYILCALLYTGFFLSLIRNEISSEGLRWGLVAGMLGALALLTHLMSLALILSVVFLVIQGTAYKRKTTLIPCGIMVTTFVMFRLARGMLVEPAPNPSMISFFVGNGLAEEVLDEERLQFLVAYTLTPSSVAVILENIAWSTKHIISTLFVVSGPLVVFLFLGTYHLIARRKERVFGICLSILLGHLCVWLLFPFNKFRFVVPILPLVFYVIGIGIEAFQGRRYSWLIRVIRISSGRIVVIFVMLFIAYNIFYLARFPHTFYYKSRPGTAARYNEMREAIRWFKAEIGCGNLLGYSRTLDGGTETYYFHRCPFADGRPFISYPHLLPRLIDRYDIEYIWTDKGVRSANGLLAALPVLYESDTFLILRSR
jgi:hypothetical protein